MSEFQSSKVQAGLTPEQQALVSSTLRSILQSSHFAKSKRYPALLEYSVRSTLEGHVDALKERTVGMEVFGRSANYDPSTESVVRNAASEVRKRLALYYGTHQDAPVRIDLPPGTYSAEFSFCSEPGSEQDAAGQQATGTASSAPRPGRARRRWAVAAVSVVIVALVAVWGVRHFAPGSPLVRFWSPLLTANQPLTICLGAPFERTPPPSVVGLPDSAMVNYMHQLPDSPVPDITAANSIEQFLNSLGTKSEIRMANSIQLSDLHRSPAVLVGASPMNPWAARLGANLRFQFLEAGAGSVHGIVDTRNPAKGTWNVDIKQAYDHVPVDYALITRELSPVTGQWWFGIGGTTAISTAEAEHTVLDPVAMRTLESQFPRGWEHKNLQVVVEFTLVSGSVGSSRVVASYVW